MREWGVFLKMRLELSERIFIYLRGGVFVGCEQECSGYAKRRSFRGGGGKSGKNSIFLS